MSSNRLLAQPLLAHADLLRSGTPTFTAWVSTGNPFQADLLAREDFDSVTLDMQHGMFDDKAIIDSITYAALAGKPALVRIEVDAFPFASRALDYGAMGVIAPMVNSVADAKKLVAYTKYPPLGERSWGPVRCVSLTGLSSDDYLQQANRATVAIAMIETQAALEALDDILAVEGLDGVFVGPSDLSITLSKGKKVDQQAPDVEAALAHILARAKAHGKFATAFTMNGARAAHHAAMGYAMSTICNDIYLLQVGARSELKAARGAAGGKGGSAY